MESTEQMGQPLSLYLPNANMRAIAPKLLRMKPLHIGLAKRKKKNITV